MREEFEELDDDQLHESYEAYKALLEAGVPQKDALKKTGLTPQIVKDFEEEEKEFEDDEFKDDFKEVWGSDDEDFNEDDWKEEEFEEDNWEDSSDDYSEDYDEYDEAGGGYDDKDF